MFVQENTKSGIGYLAVDSYAAYMSTPSRQSAAREPFSTRHRSKGSRPLKDNRARGPRCYRMRRPRPQSPEGSPEPQAELPNA